MTGRTVLVFVLALSGALAWAQNKPKQPQSVPDSQLQTQKPTAAPLQTQPLPAQPSQTQKPVSSPQAASVPAGELFLMPVPKGWKQISVDQHFNIRTVQFVPEGQTAEKSEEIVRSMVFSFVKDAPLENFLTQAIGLPNNQCLDVFMSPITKGLINGYESVFTTRFCTKNKQSGQGEVAMFKLIQGKYGLYLGERSWRVKPYGKDKPPVPKETFESWAEYMKAVTLCVPDDALRQCPKGAGQ